jgi:cysteinyl-tRNA synthetase
MAQTCCAFGTEVMANYWMHNGHLQVEGEKMSKSTGNFVTIHDLLHTDKFGGRSWPGEVLRLALLRTHYRQPIDFTLKALEEAESRFNRWRNTVRRVGSMSISVPHDFLQALADDFNTHAALEVMGRYGATANRVSAMQGVAEGDALPPAVSDEEAQNAASQLVACADILGLELRSVVEQLMGPKERDLFNLRLAARAEKNWKESDRIRDELAAMGIALKDNKDGTTTWEVKR